MVKRPKENPNTKENWEKHYSARLNKPERVNLWLIPYLKQYLPKGVFNCLEVGCGRGQSIIEILEINPLALVTGADHSEVALKCANERIPELDTICQDIHSPIYGKFDFVLCSQTLEHVDDPGGAIKQMKAAVIKGGRLMITVPYPRSNLDRGVFWHVNTFEEKYFTKLLPGCKVIKSDKDHLIVVWNK